LSGRLRALPRVGLGAASALVLAGASAAANGAAPDYPIRPIRLISPFAPGGGNDIVSRTIGVPLSRDLGQSVVVDNRPGANTIIGMELVAKAAPDGYTMIMTSSTQAINATLYPKLPYDSIKDFSPVSLVGASPLVVAVPAASPITGIPGLIAAAKAKPGELSYPSAGTGNATHLGGELFGAMAGVRLLHVPYKGAAPGINDLIAGRLELVFGTSPSVMPHVRSGRLRALATTGAKRSLVVPDAPTVAEAGVPGYEATTWYGVLVPGATPRAIVTRLNQAIVATLAGPEVRERLVAQGVDPVGNAPEEFAAYLRSEIVKWANVIKAAGVKPE
jgi:tripartite-type tricarboxylate transporter receptor subunit TctC